MHIRRNLSFASNPFHENLFFIIRGIKDGVETAKRTVELLKEKGHDVLSEHVVHMDDFERMNEIRTRKSGIDATSHEHPWKAVREIDTKWVDEADVLVAMVNSPSHGVGMEIERALTRHERGLKPCRVVCFVRKDRLEKLSWMIRGIDSWNFRLVVYESFNDIKIAIDKLIKSTNPRVVVFLLRDGKILLGKRKEKFGNGLYVGLGGKIEEGEDIKEACVREVEEKSGIKINPEKLEKVAELSFVFQSKPEWSMDVSYFILKELKEKQWKQMK